MPFRSEDRRPALPRSRPIKSLAAARRRLHARPMFMVSEADAAAIRAAFDKGGELSAAVELRRRFPGIRDNETARSCARNIASWTPMPMPVKKPPARRRHP